MEEFDIAPDGSLLAFVSNEDGVSKLHLLDTRSRKELPGPKLPPGVIDGLEFHRTLKEFAFVFVSATRPRDTYSYNWQTGELTRWTFSETGGLNPDTFPETTLIRYPTFDKVEGKPRMIPAFVIKPGARFKPPYPVVIEIHGGPEGQARPGLNSSYFVNEMGIALIKPNVRGSDGYGKTYLKLDNAMLREDSVKDIGALLDWIATRPDLDANRVAVMGGFIGSTPDGVTTTLGRGGSDFSAAIAGAGIGDLLDHGVRHLGAGTLARPVATEVVDDDLGAAAGQEQGMAAAQPAAGPGHDRHASFEVDVSHVRILLKRTECFGRVPSASRAPYRRPAGRPFSGEGHRPAGILPSRLRTPPGATPGAGTCPAIKACSLGATPSPRHRWAGDTGRPRAGAGPAAAAGSRRACDLARRHVGHRAVPRGGRPPRGCPAGGATCRT